MWSAIKEKITVRLLNLKKKANYTLSIWKAIGWNKLYWIHHYVLKFIILNRTKLISGLLIFLITTSFYLGFIFDEYLNELFFSNTKIEDCKTALVTIGGALIGAGAISFSFVMFVLQVNIERMPHSLFWKFSSDKKIIFTFTAIIILSIGIVFLSLFAVERNLVITLITVCWIVVIVIVLIIYAYRRTLILINPIQQLSQIADDAKAQFKLWEKRADRARPLYKQPSFVDNDLGASKHDEPLFKYFQKNTQWISEPKKAINHAISYSRRYAEYGDYTVSNHALAVLTEVNGLYIQTKGKTFFANNPLFHNPLSTDEFINLTLEQLRQNFSIAFSRKDEQQIEQTLKAVADLTLLYMDIDYSYEHTGMQHTRLAVGYLSDGVKSALRHGYTDVVMEGLRLLSRIADLLISRKSTNEVVTIINDIGDISIGTVINKKDHPATATGIDQLAKLTIILLQTDDMQVRFALKQINAKVSSIAKTILHLSASNLISDHSTSLNSYYSGTSFDSLQNYLTKITNSVINAKEGDEKAQQIIRNIEEWADNNYLTEKELLLLSIEKRSNFTFDIISWITHLSKLLLALSTAEACHFHYQDKLRKRALWLFSTLTWIEDDHDTISFVASYDITEKIFEMVIEARTREAIEMETKVNKILFDWTFKAGKYQNGWAILENSIYALIVVSLTGKYDPNAINLKKAIEDKLNEIEIDKEKLLNTASHIRHQADHLFQLTSHLSIVKGYMSQIDRKLLKSVMIDIALIFEENS